MFIFFFLYNAHSCDNRTEPQQKAPDFIHIHTLNYDTSVF